MFPREQLSYCACRYFLLRTTTLSWRITIAVHCVEAARTIPMSLRCDHPDPGSRGRRDVSFATRRSRRCCDRPAPLRRCVNQRTNASNSRATTPRGGKNAADQPKIGRTAECLWRHRAVKSGVLMATSERSWAFRRRCTAIRIGVLPGALAVRCMAP